MLIINAQTTSTSQGDDKRQSYLLPELQDVAVIVSDGELPHAVFEVFERIDDGGFVSQLLPERLNVVGMEIERTGELDLVERFVRVGQGKHEFDIIFPQASLGLGAPNASEAQYFAIEIDRCRQILRPENGGESSQLHGGSI